ncbi:PLP-dependent aminotransferase family protein [Bacillus sp. AFS088145]|uniref:aminotransferase-like domain-containing protein n=1 Tax=Bacillus sp. AFS088145 TaxID=2033514 RepID=UPI000BF86A6E|nr:PLP-dependent aminotransferase family protein [Bacillus sp. AFS088145]PFH88713.1 GntR family transcriptional regulator [Bacillus sp. AFS088145]
MLKHEYVYQTLLTQIQAGELKAGTKIPSIRKLAELFSCSKSSILAALEKLENQHLIYAKPKSGYYVVEHKIFKEPSKTTKIDFATSAPNWHSFPYQDFQHCLNKAIDTFQSDLFRYGTQKGLPSLINEVEKILQSYQVFAQKKQIFITSGVQQALFLLSTMPFLNNRKKILVEQPSYHIYMDLVKLHQLPIVGIKRTIDGINLQQLEEIFSEGDIKFFYTMPRFQNPLGTSLSKKEKLETLKLAHKYDVYIVEDDYLADFEYTKKNDPLFANDLHGRVIYLKSFSKIMFPGLRIGIAVLPDSLIETFQQFKTVIDIDSSMISQAALELYLKSGMFEHYQKNVRDKYLARAKILQTSLETHLTNYDFASDIVMHSHIVLPKQVDMNALLNQLDEYDILIDSIKKNYLDNFYQERILKLNVSNCEPTDIEKGIKQISYSLKDTNNYFE